MGFDGKVAGVKQMRLGFRVVALERLGAGRCETKTC